MTPEIAPTGRDTAHVIANDLPLWQVARQDDNGNVFAMRSGLTYAEALALTQVFEARGHKQSYWVETMPSAGLFPFLPFERERIRMRRLREDDFSRFLAYRSDPAVARFQGWAPMSATQAADALRDHAACADHPAGEWRQFAIAAASDDGLLGDLGLWLAQDGREAEIGLSVAPAAQGQGVGAAAVRAVCDLLFAHSRVRCVRAAADARNAPCLRMLGRAGLQETGRQHAVWKGEPCIDIAFARFKDAD